mmetsp:Transcript_7894/g.13238  ORF Transcript_7894/g.13238 Transcript_7894/m.13238 type:complete len:414 (+) Transcript_7894:157-1398(+)
MAQLHKDMNRRQHLNRMPVRKKFKHPKNKEEHLNIDNRLSNPLRCLFSEKERMLHSAFVDCDVEKYPTLSVGDGFVRNLDDLLNVMGETESFENWNKEGFGLLGISSLQTVHPGQEERLCMSEDLLDALYQDFEQDKYLLHGKRIRIARLDASDPQAVDLAAEIGLKIDKVEAMLEPQLVFFYKGEFFHWNHGWLRHYKVKLLHWINRIAYPIKQIHTQEQLDKFIDPHVENREVTPFFLENPYQAQGSFFKNSELRTRALILDENMEEVHDAYLSARHLADRHDLRFAFSTNTQILKSFDKKFNFLTMNQRMNGEYEALVVFNHFEKKTQMGLHPNHNEFAEQSILEFVNRDSMGPVDDFNADTALPYSIVEMEPLLLIFTQLDIWEKDKKEAEHQRTFIDVVLRDLYNFDY